MDSKDRDDGPEAAVGGLERQLSLFEGGAGHRVGLLLNVYKARKVRLFPISFRISSFFWPVVDVKLRKVTSTSFSDRSPLDTTRML